MSNFFALMARMKYIRRWGLMRSDQPENIQEHSLQVAMIAHALAVIGNERFERSYDAEHIACIAMYHEVSEIMTGDLPTPIKYHNPAIRDAYHAVEALAEEKILSLLPADLQPTFEPLIRPKDGEEKKLVKAADRLCAYLKCVEETQAGNREFTDALSAIEGELKNSELPEVQVFMKEFVSGFSLTLDQLKP